MRLRRILRWIGRGFFAAFCLVAIFGLGGFVWLKSSLPKLDGALALAGLAGPVEIVRDANGVPHIFAGQAADAYLALGYVHAQDRLWQMEMQRRAGAGRLAELVGAPGLGLDRLTRTLGLYRLAEASRAHFSPEVRAALDSYVAGVNAYIDNHKGAWPPEYYALGTSPEPWRPADSLVWGRLMALQLATNWRSEILRARIAKRLGEARLDDLFPAYPGAGPVTLADADSRLGDLSRPHRLAAAPANDVLGPPGASNEWVVAGSRSASGKPILANDPHLGLSAPILWYLARIEAPDLSIAGATVPGSPFHLLGHNGRIAWGFTNTYADTDDIFIERLDPDDAGKYLAPGGPRRFVTRREIIKVKDGEPVTLVVRESRHGPVIEELLTERAPELAEDGTVMTLAAPWLREDDRTTEAIYRLNRAAGWADFTRALSLFGAPVQNIAYADVAGHIGIYAPGRIPVRKNGDGYRRAAGWTGDHDWTGFIPFERLPHGLDPESGVLINANNRLVDGGYPYLISREWGGSRRAQRAADLLNGGGPHTPEASQAMQADTVSYAARDLLPLLLPAAPDEPRARAAAAMLRAWDHRMDRGRPEPLIFTAWFRALNRLLYGDELGPLLDVYWGLRPEVVKRMLTGGGPWCDDVTTGPAETCDEIIAAALTTALEQLTDAYGANMTDWRWGDAHYADLRHRVFDFVPVIRSFANIRLPADGGSFTLNRAGSRVRDAAAPYADRHAAGFRAVYDLADLGASRFIIASGQSGNPLSPHYDDFAERWRDVRYVRLAGSRDALAADGVGVLKLVPIAAEPRGDEQ